jgi:multidrug efflux pump subunit AcrA (membrane-fusion protein)
MTMRHRLIPLLLVLGLGLGYVGYQWWTTRDIDPNRVTAAGTLEGDRIVVASELAGRVATVLVERGTVVEPGQLAAAGRHRVAAASARAPAGGPEQQLADPTRQAELKAPHWRDHESIDGEVVPPARRC